jgi:hypothetical protein
MEKSIANMALKSINDMEQKGILRLSTNMAYVLSIEPAMLLSKESSKKIDFKGLLHIVGK